LSFDESFLFLTGTDIRESYYLFHNRLNEEVMPVFLLYMGLRVAGSLAFVLYYYFYSNSFIRTRSWHKSFVLSTYSSFVHGSFRGLLAVPGLQHLRVRVWEMKAGRIMESLFLISNSRARGLVRASRCCCFNRLERTNKNDERLRRLLLFYQS
jgi:hypothetical protein